MKHIVPTVATLALLGAAAPAQAASIKDDTVNLGVKLVIQERISLLNDASSATGTDYDPLRGTGGKAEAARFYIRRARVAFEAKYMDDWRFNLTIRAGEKTNISGQDTSPSALLYYAYLGRVFKTEGMEHEIKLGLYKPFNNESSISSSTFVLGVERFNSEQTEERRPGIGYLLSGEMFRVGVDLMNNSTGTKDVTAQNGTGEETTNGYFYSARAEFSPGKEWWIAKKTESFCGEEGKGLLIGIDYQADNGILNNDGSPTTVTKQKYVVYGPDVLFHWNQITALAEARWRTSTSEVITDATGASTSTDIKAFWFDVQAAYAQALDSGIIIEPAIGFAKYDGDKDTDTKAVYGGGSDNAVTSKFGGAGSGRTIDLGFNTYFNKHGNKLQVSFQLWKAESGDGDAKIIRITHQISF